MADIELILDERYILSTAIKDRLVVNQYYDLLSQKTPEFIPNIQMKEKMQEIIQQEFVKKFPAQESINEYNNTSRKMKTDKALEDIYNKFSPEFKEKHKAVANELTRLLDENNFNYGTRFHTNPDAPLFENLNENKDINLGSYKYFKIFMFLYKQAFINLGYDFKQTKIRRIPREVFIYTEWQYRYDFTKNIKDANNFTMTLEELFDVSHIHHIVYNNKHEYLSNREFENPIIEKPSNILSVYTTYNEYMTHCYYILLYFIYKFELWYMFKMNYINQSIFSSALTIFYNYMFNIGTVRFSEPYYDFTFDNNKKEVSFYQRLDNFNTIFYILSSRVKQDIAIEPNNSGILSAELIMKAMLTMLGNIELYKTTQILDLILAREMARIIYENNFIKYTNLFFPMIFYNVLMNASKTKFKLEGMYLQIYLFGELHIIDDNFMKDKKKLIDLLNKARRERAYIFKNIKKPMDYNGYIPNKAPKLKDDNKDWKYIYHTEQENIDEKKRQLIKSFYYNDKIKELKPKDGSITKLIKQQADTYSNEKAELKMRELKDIEDKNNTYLQDFLFIYFNIFVYIKIITTIESNKPINFLVITNDKIPDKVYKKLKKEKQIAPNPLTPELKAKYKYLKYKKKYLLLKDTFSSKIKN